MKFKKVLTGIIAGGLILGLGITVFANDISTAAASQTNPFKKINNQTKFKKSITAAPFKKYIQQFVEKSIISQEQADKWMKFCNEQREKRKAEMQEIKNMTKEERKAYFAERHKKKMDPLSKAVEEGIILQKQADQIKEQMPIRQKRWKKNKQVI